MDIWDIVTFFIVGFFFGLTFRLLYGMMMGNYKQQTKAESPKNVRYISPKVDETMEHEREPEEDYGERKVANQ